MPSSSTTPTKKRTTPSRFSKSTKAAKQPDIVSPPEGINGGSPDDSAQDVVVVTPSKRRRLNNGDVRQRNSAPSPSESVPSIYVTPTKRNTAQKDTYLPTPPITPNLSVSVSLSPSRGSAVSASPTSPTSPSASLLSRSPSPCTTPPVSTSSNIYARARSLLRLSTSTESSRGSKCVLLGRETEKEALESFLRANLPAFNDDASPSEVDSTADSAPVKALYISGSPGSGKTALLTHILSRLEGKATGQVRVAFLNCTTVQRGDDIWERIIDELGLGDKKGRGRARCDQESFERLMRDVDGIKSKDRCLVVLDEMDHLLTSTTSTLTASNVLSTLYKLALLPASRLVLIGIANALDLTQRHLHLLQADHSASHDSLRHGHTPLTPELLHFRPFQASEMVEIAKDRLMRLHGPDRKDEDSLPLPVILPAALELSSKKVAAITGDLRSFLSLVRKAVEIFEGEQRQRYAAQQDANGTPTKNKGQRRTTIGSTGDQSSDVLAHFDATSAPRLTPAHILKATRLVSLHTSSSPAAGSTASISAPSQSGTFSSTSSSNLVQLESKLAELNLQQRLALTSFVVAIQYRENELAAPYSTASPSKHAADLSIKPSELHSLYKSLLQKEDLLAPVGSSEFLDLISGLHTRGLVGFEADHQRGATSTSMGRSASNGSFPSSLVPPAPMMRRSSSSTSAGSGRARTSRSPSPSTSQAPLVLLYSVSELVSAIKSPKSSNGVSEANSICTTILCAQERKIRRIKINNHKAREEKLERQKNAREGFNGDGIEHLGADVVGKRDRTGRDAEEDDETLVSMNAGQDQGKADDDDDDLS